MNEIMREEHGNESKAEQNGEVRPAGFAMKRTEDARLLTLAAEALSAEDFAQAQHFADEAIALNDADAAAWELRAEAAAGRQGSALPRMEEAVNAWINAVTNCAPASADALRERIAEKYEHLLFSELKIPAEHFSAEPNADDLRRILQTQSIGLQLLNTLIAQAGVTFSCGPLFNRIARLFADAAANACSVAAAGFGPAHNNMQLWQWEKYTDAGDQCLQLLEKAAPFCRDNALGKRICDLYIKIGESVRDSCAWKYDTDNAGGDPFIPDLTFTAEAKRIRTEDIKTFRTLRGYFEADQVSRLCSDLEAARADADEARALALYWQEHAEEAKRLDDETQSLTHAAQQADEDIRALPISDTIAQTRAELTALQNRLSSLGFGNRKEKRELKKAAQALSLRLPELEAEEAQQKKKLSWTIKKANARIAEIRRIFAAPRGSVPAPAGTYTFIGETDAQPSLQAFYKHLSAVLPAPYRTAALKPAEPEALPPEFAALGVCRECKIKKDSVDLAKQSTDLRLFFFAEAESEALKTVLLQAPAAIYASETDLHDFAYIGSCLLLSLLSSASQPEAENAILSLRHGNGETVLSKEHLRCAFACSESTNTEGITQLSDLILFQLTP